MCTQVTFSAVSLRHAVAQCGHEQGGQREMVVGSTLHTTLQHETYSCERQCTQPHLQASAVAAGSASSVCGRSTKACLKDRASLSALRRSTAAPQGAGAAGCLLRGALTAGQGGVQVEAPRQPCLPGGDFGGAAVEHKCGGDAARREYQVLWKSGAQAWVLSLLLCGRQAGGRVSKPPLLTAWLPTAHRCAAGGRPPDFEASQGALVGRGASTNDADQRHLCCLEGRKQKGWMRRGRRGKGGWRQSWLHGGVCLQVAM